MHFTIDENISYGAEVFSRLGTIALVNGRALTNSDLANTDVLIVRSVTTVNEKLLTGTPVKFVGTATIGTDHIDKAYLQHAGIAFADAKGCNADAVTEFVITSLIRVMRQMHFTPNDLKIGIVGCGNIGGRLARLLPEIGFRVVLNDPPLQRLNPGAGYASMEDILECDVITFHTPLTTGGPDATRHLFDAAKLSRAKNLKILINASRGAVVHNEALLEELQNRNIVALLDVWENEPEINPDLLRAVKYATPHIAGYSFEGKLNGTKMMYDAVCKFLHNKQEYEDPDFVFGVFRRREPFPDIIASKKQSLITFLDNICRVIYDIELDSHQLKSSQNMQATERGRYFSMLRKNYSPRFEFPNYHVIPEPANAEYTRVLRALRFISE